MRLLLDTDDTFLWFLLDDPHLSTTAKELICPAQSRLLPFEQISKRPKLRARRF